MPLRELSVGTRRRGLARGEQRQGVEQELCRDPHGRVPHPGGRGLPQRPGQGAVPAQQHVLVDGLAGGVQQVDQQDALGGPARVCRRGDVAWLRPCARAGSAEQHAPGEQRTATQRQPGRASPHAAGEQQGLRPGLGVGGGLGIRLVCRRERAFEQRQCRRVEHEPGKRQRRDGGRAASRGGAEGEGGQLAEAHPGPASAGGGLSRMYPSSRTAASSGSSAWVVAATIGSSRHVVSVPRRVQSCPPASRLLTGIRTSSGSISTGPTRNEGSSRASAGAVQSRTSSIDLRGTIPLVTCTFAAGSRNRVSRSVRPGRSQIVEEPAAITGASIGRTAAAGAVPGPGRGPRSPRCRPESAASEATDGATVHSRV